MKDSFDNKNLDDLKYYIYDILSFCYGNYRDKNYILAVFERTTDIVEKLKECDETSATKCFTCINEIKELMKYRL